MACVFINLVAAILHGEEMVKFNSQISKVVFILQIRIINPDWVILEEAINICIWISREKLGFGFIYIYCEFIFVAPSKNSV